MVKYSRASIYGGETIHDDDDDDDDNDNICHSGSNMTMTVFRIRRKHIASEGANPTLRWFIQYSL